MRPPEEVIKVDEYRENGDLVIKAEMPGIDPDKDLEPDRRRTGCSTSAPKRRIEEDTEDKDATGTSCATAPSPAACPCPTVWTPRRVARPHKDGILAVRVPMPEPAAGAEPTTVAIEKG